MVLFDDRAETVGNILLQPRQNQNPSSPPRNNRNAQNILSPPLPRPPLTRIVDIVPQSIRVHLEPCDTSRTSQGDFQRTRKPSCSRQKWLGGSATSRGDQATEARENERKPERHRATGSLSDGRRTKTCGKLRGSEMSAVVTTIVWGQAMDVNQIGDHHENHRRTVVEDFKHSTSYGTTYMERACKIILWQLLAIYSSFIPTHSDASTVFDSESVAPVSHASSYPILTLPSGYPKCCNYLCKAPFVTRHASGFPTAPERPDASITYSDHPCMYNILCIPYTRPCSITIARVMRWYRRRC